MPKIKVKETKTVKAEVDENDLARSIAENWSDHEVANFLIELFDSMHYGQESTFVTKATAWGYRAKFEAWTKGDAS
jgi:hypothetical protein